MSAMEKNFRRRKQIKPALDRGKLAPAAGRA
jgi:hypothetical protein